MNTKGPKVMTDSPLIDEIVYQCNQMIQGIVLKDELEADNNETLESLRNADTYFEILDGKARFNSFVYTYKTISKLPYLTKAECRRYANDNSTIPPEIKESLKSIAETEFINNYEEMNNYYRKLYGLPNYGEQGIYLSKDDIDKLIVEEFDYGKMVHEMNNNEIAILEASGILDDLKDRYPNEKYLNYVGERKINPRYARKSQKFGLLYLPRCDSTEVYDKFVGLLEINRQFILKTVYSDAYKFQSVYYDRIMMIMIIIQTFDDMINLAPEYIIRKDLFDMRTIEYVFRACGVDFFPEIPLKYQKRLVKNLNRLIKYKSCDKNLIDISKLFGFDDIQIFKYYLLKIPLTDENGEYIRDVIEDPVTGDDIEDLENNYELQFLKVPLEGNYDDYIRDKGNYVDYEYIRQHDVYWDGIYTREYVRNEILKHEFNANISKYISVDSVYSLSEMSFQLIYFINMLLYGNIDLSLLNIDIPEISSTMKFNIVDLFITLYSLSYLYHGIKDNIIYDPVQSLAVKGFNFETDLGVLNSFFEEKDTSIDELLEGLDEDKREFNSPEAIISFNQLIDTYRNNKDIYDYIVNKLYNANNKREYDLYWKLHESLYVTRLNFDYFRQTTEKEPKTYQEFLANKDTVLYNIIMNCSNIVREDERREEITKYIGYITDSIYVYLDKDEFQYIFQGIPTVSIDYIREYMMLIVKFFMSYKVDMLHSNKVYIFDDKLENKIKVIDDIFFKYLFDKDEFVYADDFIKKIITKTSYDKVDVLEKIYFNITWYKILLFKDVSCPFRDHIAEMWVHLLKQDTIRTEITVSEFNHTYDWSQYITLIENDEFNIHKTIKDTNTIEDNLFMHYTENI